MKKSGTKIYCTACNENPDGPERRCKKCRSVRVLQARKRDPVLQLHHRWTTNVRVHWPKSPKELRSVETIRYVYERWKGKSVLSENSTVQDLCITPFDGLAQEPNSQRLVIVTTKEAQTLGRMKATERVKAFPTWVQEAMVKK